jgi:hypothetical protein
MFVKKKNFLKTRHSTNAPAYFQAEYIKQHDSAKDVPFGASLTIELLFRGPFSPKSPK